MRDQLRRSLQWLRANWRTIGLYALILAAVSVCITYAIQTLLPGYSALEVQYVQKANALSEILKHPDYLPHKLITYILFKISPDLVRFASGFIAIGFIVSAIYLLRQVYSVRSVVMGTVLLTTSSWVLVIGRLTIPDSGYLLLPVVAALILWGSRTVNSWVIVPIASLLLIPLVYLPGVMWLLLATAFLFRQKLRTILSVLKPWQLAVVILTVLLGLIPLVFGLTENMLLGLTVLGLPNSLEALQVAHITLYEQLATVFYESTRANSLTLSTLPLLDIFTSVFVLIGLYRVRYWNKKAIIWFVVGGLILTALLSLGVVPVAAMLAPVYALAVSGISFMLTQWYTVFPRNPVARASGATILLVSVFLIGFFHITKYYVAWAQAPQTKHTYSQSLLE